MYGVLDLSFKLFAGSWMTLVPALHPIMLLCVGIMGASDNEAVPAICWWYWLGCVLVLLSAENENKLTAVSVWSLVMTVWPLWDFDRYPSFVWPPGFGVWCVCHQVNRNPLHGVCRYSCSQIVEKEQFCFLKIYFCFYVQCETDRSLPCLCLKQCYLGLMS